MQFLKRLFGLDRTDNAYAFTYRAIVAEGRQPVWYTLGGITDSVDGRFDMIALVLALVLRRLGQEPDTTGASARLVEQFVDDMDAQLREFGVGDVVIGKRIGKLVGALDGRTQVLSEALDGDPRQLPSVLERNLAGFREASPEQQKFTTARVQALNAQLAAAPTSDILSGDALELA